MHFLLPHLITPYFFLPSSIEKPNGLSRDSLSSIIERAAPIIAQYNLIQLPFIVMNLSALMEIETEV